MILTPSTVLKCWGGFGKVGPMILTPTIVPMLGRVWQGCSYDSNPEYSTNVGEGLARLVL